MTIFKIIVTHSCILTKKILFFTAKLFHFLEVNISNYLSLNTQIC